MSFLWGVVCVANSQAKVSKKKQKKKVLKIMTATAKQGICGIVLWKGGNQMPSPEQPRPESTGSPVQRQVYVYELTNLKNVSEVDGFYTDIKAKMVAMVVSDNNGKFCITLPVGKYSVFVKEEKGYYANTFDESMNIFPVSVQSDKNTSITFTISHSATF